MWEEEEKEEEEKDSSDLFLTLHSWPCSSPTPAVASPGWFSSVLAVFPSYVGRPKLPGIIVGLDQYYSLLRARHRQWQWHVQGWFRWLLFALCPFWSTDPGCFASWPVWTRRTGLPLFGISLCKARFIGDSAPRAVSLFLLLSVPDARHPGRHGPEGNLCSEVVAALVADYGSGMFLLVLLVDAVRAVFTSLSAGPPAGGQLCGMAGFAGDDSPRAVFLICLHAQDARHFGRYGPVGQLRRRGQGLRSCSPWCGARVHCRMWIGRRRQGLRSRSPGFCARVHCRMLQLIIKVVYTLSWRRSSPGCAWFLGCRRG